ncbi:MAG: PduL/EutD family phosphate acyltransferase [Patescibacteria group bacterium]
MHIPVVVQYRHVHFSARDLEAVLGQTTPEVLQTLSHHGQVVYKQTVQIFGSDGFLDRVHVLGPAREHTQVEISPTDAATIGLHAPVRLSGDTDRAGTCRIKGPHGEIRAAMSVIVPARHLHLNEAVAKKLNLHHGQSVCLRVSTTSLQIDHVTVRIHPSFVTEFHLTTDEAATYWLHTGDTVQLCA